MLLSFFNFYIILIGLAKLLNGTGKGKTRMKRARAEPLVSVLLPVKNEEKNIADCIRSLKKQSYKSIEIIVIDGNSTDKTVEIAKKMGAKVFNEYPPKSSGNARNIGAKNAKGKYVVFVDADCTLNSDYVKNAVSILENNGFDGIYHKSVLYPTRKILPKLSHLEREFSQQYYCPEIIKRSVYLKLMFNPKLFMGEDYDFGTRFKEKYKGIYVDLLKSYHKEPDLKKLIKESFSFGRTYPNILRMGYPRVLISFLWTSAVALMLPLVFLSIFLPILRLPALLILSVFSLYSLYKIVKMWKSDLKFLFPFFKILRYTLIFIGVILGMVNFLK